MSFDRATRNLLAAAVGKARERLKGEVLDQLRRLGLQDDGTVLEIAAIGGLAESERAASADVRALLAHLTAAERGTDGAGAKGRSEREIAQAAHDRMAREIGFTTLNRLVALRMAEERGLIVQSVSAGLASSGFQLYERVAGGALGSRHETYRAYLECLYDEIARDLPALFDRTDPHSRIFPGERCLEDVLALLNSADLAHLWREDETIGWVYQYYNDPDERKKMRESQAPRTSRELAVRNQFFTPRYVVEFLTDNTLGRTWYEMRQGDTKLVDQCRYMVRRKRPVFLAPDQDPPRPWQPASNLESPVPSDRAATTHPTRNPTPDAEVHPMRNPGLQAGEWVMSAAASRGLQAAPPVPDHGSAPPVPFHRSPHPLDAIWTRPNPDLNDLDAISDYALTFNGYHYAQEHLGATEDTALAACGAVAERLAAVYHQAGKWQGGLEELRVALFFWQCRFHHWGEIPDDSVPDYRALYQAICRQWDLETEYIPYRIPKDPRDLKILDPACGSGHFLLYAFDLLATIYEEAWAWDDARRSEVTGATLRADFPDLANLRRAIPALILAHNLHGIDIDPRACQIAALALWLRAQRAYQSLGLKGADRPAISRGNIVCAAPMPGERSIFTRFLADLNSPTLARVAQAMWDELALAGVAGSLLKPEERLRQVIAEERAAYQRRPRVQQLTLTPEFDRSEDQPIDFSDVTDERFWDLAEERILAVLRVYSESVEDGDTTTRRLFAADGVQGFQFVELVRQLYDVVLMNPPFGKSAIESQNFIEVSHSQFKSDVGLAFVDHWSDRLNYRGVLGAISSRAFLASDGLVQWRRRSILNAKPLRALLDLGYGVLDDAMVEAAAYIVQQGTVLGASATFYRLLESRDKAEGAANAVASGHGNSNSLVFFHTLDRFVKTPLCVICYWMPDALLRAIIDTPTLTESNGNARHGLVTTDDFQFLRTTWEIPLTALGKELRWALLAKGGEYRPYWDDVHLVVDWLGEGARLKSFLAQKRLLTQGSPDWSPWLNHHEYYFEHGLTYPERTTSDFGPRLLQRDVAFSSAGQAIQFNDDRLALAYLSGSFSRLFRFLIESFVGSGDNSVSGSAAKHYRSGLLNQLPSPLIDLSPDLQTGVEGSIAFFRSCFMHDETSREYIGPKWHADYLKPSAMAAQSYELHGALAAIMMNYEVERAVNDRFRVRHDDLSVLDAIVGNHPAEYRANGDDHVQDCCALWKTDLEDLVQIAVDINGARRQLTKKSYIADRKLELICHILHLPPDQVVAHLCSTASISPGEYFDNAQDLNTYFLGVVFGRWDARIGKDPALATTLGGAFDALPICSPGMLTEDAAQVGVNGPLPYRPERLPAEPHHLPAGYPVAVQWSGILVDDPEHREDDLVRRVQAVLAYLFEDRAGAIEQEACEILKVKSLRDYFRRPATFFAHHLSQYSKSRRQAPIYWPLSTASGSYTLWLYYHRLTSDTLFTAVNRYVLPKIAAVERDLADLEARLAAASGREATRLREEGDDLRAFRDELVAFRAELERVAALPYRPDLNDGVIINAAPLHRLFRLPKWAKDTKECWTKLERGDYDWAHLAYTIWPDRVREKCRTDKSLAIAHGLEDRYVAPPATASKRRGRAAPPPDEEQDDNGA